jgi:two-component system CheB/CheR fusion protein
MSDDDHGVEHEMAAVVVHQLRNRLSRVLFGADALLACELESPQARSLAARLKRGVDDLTGWLDQLVELTQLLSGEVELRLERVDLHALVHDAVERAQPLLASRKHSNLVEGLDEPLLVEADRLGLEIVVANLITNAAKFTPPGGNIQLRAVCAAGAVHLHVSDDGVGIPPAQLATVFELSRGEAREHGATRQIRTGLFVVRRIVELHGGSVHARSGDRKGTEMVVRIPRQSVLGRAGEPQRALVISSARTGSLAAVLRSRGYQVDAAPSGDAAVALAVDTRWDLVLVDAQVAVREDDLAERLRAASLGAMLLLVGAGPSTLGIAAEYDGSLAAGFDADLLHAAVAAR